ncbi:MAG TPA: hypothetical protein VFN11_18865 [Ktedonobacterales bacterium]|nr:hypothetical protein [Ktedonobacterales bacterium]
MHLSPSAQNLFSLALAATWAVGGILLYIRMRSKQVEYLRRFPPVAGVPLYMASSDNPFGVVSRRIWVALSKRQTEPGLEALRREIWRRFRYMTFWIYGFPLITIGVIALLITTGIISITAK